MPIKDQILAQTQESLSLALEAGRMGWWLRDLIREEVVWSPELEAIFGLPPGSFHGSEDAFLEFVHPDDRGKIAAAVAEAILTKGDYAVDFRFTKADGTQCWMDGRGRALYDEAGNAISLHGIGIDISERKEQEERLRESEERVRLAMECSDLATWDADLATQVTRYSAAAGPIFGRPREPFELTFEEWAACVHPDDLPHILSAIGRLIDDDVPYRVSARALHPDGTVRWVEVNGAAIRDSSGNPLRAIGVLADVTEQRQAAQVLQEANALLEERVEQRTADLLDANERLQGFTYHVSHDLRAPLRAIISTSKMIEVDYGDQIPSEVAELLHAQADAARKLSQLVDDLLKLARLSKQDMAFQDVDLSQLAREAAEEALSNHPYTTVQVQIDDGLRCKADPRLMRLALVNLIENAMKYSPGGGNVRFGEREDGTYCVSDQGIGIEPQYLERIFEPFQRLHRDEEFKGTGIGLANVKQIIERHGGRVWAESVKDEGSSFCFTLSR